MAGDWVKVEKDTPDKPEILAIAESLSISSAEVFGRCFLVWRWADSQTIDGYVRGVTTVTVDRLAGLVGFGQALIEVGWLHARTGSLQLPNFDRHMGEGAKKRALTARRMAKSRSDESDAASVTKQSPEKRREEKREGGVPPSTPSPKPPPADLLFEQFWTAFPAYRKQKKARAKIAWDKAIKRKDPQVILAAAADYAASPVGKGEFVCGPESWLNGDGWDDDRSAWQRQDRNGRNGHANGDLHSGLREYAAEAAANGTLDREHGT